MQRKNAKHMRFKGYADGGKATNSQTEFEYGTPTYFESMVARMDELGLMPELHPKAGPSDGYGNVNRVEAFTGPRNVYRTGKKARERLDAVSAAFSSERKKAKK